MVESKSYNSSGIICTITHTYSVKRYFSPFPLLQKTFNTQIFQFVFFCMLKKATVWFQNSRVMCNNDKNNNSKSNNDNLGKKGHIGSQKTQVNKSAFKKGKFNTFFFYSFQFFPDDLYFAQFFVVSLFDNKEMYRSFFFHLIFLWFD